MKKLTLALALLLGCGCAQRIVGPTFTLDSALESYDWDHHTEEEFWQTYPQFRAEYDAEVEAYETAYSH